MKLPNRKDKMHVGIAPDDARIPQHTDFSIEFHHTTKYDGQPRVDSFMSTDAVTLDEILPVFEDFLKSMGFHFKGRVDIVEDQ